MSRVISSFHANVAFSFTSCAPVCVERLPDPEHRAGRVLRDQHLPLAHHVHRVEHHLAAVGLDRRRVRVDVRARQVRRPVRRRRRGAHRGAEAGDALAAHERLVVVAGLLAGVLELPAEQAAVELQRGIEIGRVRSTHGVSRGRSRAFCHAPKLLALTGLSASPVTLTTCASSWSTTSPRCATPSIARCGWRATTRSWRPTALQALDALADRAPDALVLDVLMPHVDGLEVCRRLRAAGDRTPVLVLTARDAVPDRVRGLDAGADDYLVKPFALEELLARLRALLRRTASADADEVLRYADVELDPQRAHRAPRPAAGRAHAHRVPAARAVPAPPAPGADALADLRARVGLRLRARRRTRSRCTSATCAASSRRTGSRGCCRRCAASATSCASHELPPPHRRHRRRRPWRSPSCSARSSPTWSCATRCAARSTRRCAAALPVVGERFTLASCRRAPSPPIEPLERPVVFVQRVEGDRIGVAAQGKTAAARRSRRGAGGRRRQARRRSSTTTRVDGVHVRVFTGAGARTARRCRSRGR